MKQKTRMQIAGAVVIVTAGGSASAQALVTRAAATPSTPGSSATARGACLLPVFGPGASYHPTIHPADFSPRVTNPYFPLPPGRTYVYAGTKDGEAAINSSPRRSTPRSSTACAHVRSMTGCISTGYWKERTTDYYSQDRCGNVWYFGEDTAHPGHERARGLDRGVIPGRRGWCAAGGLHAGTPAARPAVPPGMVARNAEDQFNALSKTPASPCRTAHSCTRCAPRRPPRWNPPWSTTSTT